MKTRFSLVVLSALCAVLWCDGYAHSAPVRALTSKAGMSKSNGAQKVVSPKASTALLKTKAKPVSQPVKMAYTFPEHDAASKFAPVNPDPTANTALSQSLDRWTCDCRYADVEGDEQLLRDLIKSNLAAVAKVFSKNSNGSNDDAIKEKRRAMGAAMSAAVWASNSLRDDELAVLICDDYLLPNLDVSNPDRCDYLSREEVLFAVASVLQRAGENKKLIDLYKQWISQDTCSNNADANRMRLASLLIEQTQYEDALGFLNQIDAMGDCAAGRLLIPEIEKIIEQLRTQTAPGTNGGGE